MTAGDDDGIWLEITKTIKPITGRKKVLPPPKKLKRLDINPPVVLPPVPQSNVPPSPPPTSTIRQLKRQKIPIQSRLDLHGHTIAQAHSALLAFVRGAYGSDLRCIEIITGRGNPEKGTGQLRRHVPIWLREEKNIASLILHIEENQHVRGGSYLVLLRRNKTLA